MEDHHIAAHRIADALRVIAENLPLLSAQAADPLYDLLYANANVDLELQQAAEAVEAQAPFTPLTEDEKQRMFEAVYEEASDSSSRDQARDYMDVADWQLRADWDDRLAMEAEEDGDA